MLKAVIFDMDGVIVDSEPGYFYAASAVLKRYGKVLEKEYFEQFFGGSCADMWKATLEYTGLTDLTVPFCVKEMAKERQKLIDKEGYRPIDGVLPLIEQIAGEGVGMAIASSSPMDEILRVTKAMDIQKYFQHFVSGVDECENAKPFPDVFLLAAEKLAMKPEECLVIEDSDNGARAAKRAGMTVIGFQNLEYGNQKLEEADFVVNSMKEIDFNLCQKIARTAECKEG